MDKFDAAKKLLHEELADIETRRQQIADVLKGLGEDVGGAVKAAGKRGRPAGSSNKPKSGGGRGKRLPSGKTVKEAMLEYVRTHPQAKPKEIAEAIGAESSSVNTAMSKARKDGEIKTDKSTGTNTVVDPVPAPASAGDKKEKSSKAGKKDKAAKSGKADAKSDSGKAGDTPATGDAKAGESSAG